MAGVNRLLAALPADAQERFRRHLRPVDLASGQVLHLAGRVITDVYFPVDCLISVTITTEAGRTAETGAVGSREMVGVNAFMGGRESTHTEYLAQVPGTALRMPAAPLLDAFDRDKRVRDVFLRYTQAYIAQVSQNAACNRLHTVGRRLARWLLDCRDRVGSDDLAVTHEFLGQMLGARRAGVTEAAGRLLADGLIAAARGRVQVTDVAGLEAAACECHRVLMDEYDRLLGRSRSAPAGV